MRKILEEAVVVGNATARTVTFAARPEEGFAYYPGSAWESALFVGGYEFLDPPPQITADGPVAAPSDGARKLNARTNFFYMATGITPAMCMRLTGIGSQYIYAMRDSEGEYLDGARRLPPHASAGHPREPLLVADRSTTARPARCSRPTSTLPAPRQPVRHRRDRTPTARSTSTSGPRRPDGKEHNWLQTVPGKGWWTILRLYNPLQPFFDKTWRPSEIEPVT